MFLQNITGFMVGRDYEAGGIAKHGAKMVTAVVDRAGAEADGDRRRLVRRRQLRDVPAAPTRRGLLWMWPDARISVMGGEQAATVMTEVGQPETGAQLREQYERQGHPYYATARLWDDGVIDPRDTRDVLGLALSAAAQRAAGGRRYGVFRM